MENLNNIAEKLSNLTPSDAETLLDIFKNDYGIEHTGSAVNIEAVKEVVVEEQTSFDVVINSVVKRLDAIKALRALTGLGLKESKELIDVLPVTLKEGVTQAEAESIKSQLEGATIEIVIK